LRVLFCFLRNLFKGRIRIRIKKFNVTRIIVIVIYGGSWFSLRLGLLSIGLQGYFFDFFYVLFSTLLICRPSDSTVSEDARIEPGILATSPSTLFNLF
jgi:hypothetical protein